MWVKESYYYLLDNTTLSYGHETEKCRQQVMQFLDITVKRSVKTKSN